MSTFKSSALALAILGAVSAAPAQAYVMASSVIQLSNFRIYLSADGSTQGAQADAGNFSSLVYNSNADMDGSLTGFTAFGSTGSTANTDFPATCIGSGCVALGLTNNSFPNLAPPPVGDYSAADQLESGSPITGVAGLTSPATISNAAYTALATGTGAGSANSNNGLSSTFTFSLAQNTALNFTGLVSAFMDVAITSDEVDPSTAQANYEFSFILRNASGTAVWGFAPDLLGTGIPGVINQGPISVDAPVAVDTNFPYTLNNLAFSVFTPLLVTGQSYTLTARSNANVDVTRQVPEPGVLGLLGLGLVGMSLARRAQKRA